MDNSKVLELVVVSDDEEPRVYYASIDKGYYMAFWGELFHKNSIF